MAAEAAVEATVAVVLAEAPTEFHPAARPLWCSPRFEGAGGFDCVRGSEAEAKVLAIGATDSLLVFESSTVEPHPPSPTNLTCTSNPWFSLRREGTLMGFGAAARVAGFFPRTVRLLRADILVVDFFVAFFLCRAFRLEALKRFLVELI
jgi:hypothetical protein